jgi:uncharacterized cupredoxin-like copper-binding protein
VNHYWFQPERTGTFLAQCMEYCGVGHPYMRAELIVFPLNETTRILPPTGDPNLPLGNETCDDCAAILNITAAEGAACTGGGLCFDPVQANAPAGQKIRIVLMNAGRAQHNLCVEFQAGQEPVCVPAGPADYLPGGETRGKNVNTPGPGSYTYWCNVPGHRQAGMVGTLTVA